VIRKKRKRKWRDSSLSRCSRNKLTRKIRRPESTSTWKNWNPPPENSIKPKKLGKKIELFMN